ncbi:MAG: hypothetical protein LBF43_01160 [Puniceicoccales bacterium]|jgi:hypothetical protein|nr:hypothetical protein [Puniceicoccales bacterium]
MAKKIGKVINRRRKATKAGSIPVKFPLIIENEQAQMHEATNKNNIKLHPIVQIQNGKLYRAISNRGKAGKFSGMNAEEKKCCYFEKIFRRCEGHFC